MGNNMVVSHMDDSSSSSASPLSSPEIKRSRPEERESDASHSKSMLPLNRPPELWESNANPWKVVSGRRMSVPLLLPNLEANENDSIVVPPSKPLLCAFRKRFSYESGDTLAATSGVSLPTGKPRLQEYAKVDLDSQIMQMALPLSVPPPGLMISHGNLLKLKQYPMPLQTTKARVDARFVSPPSLGEREDSRIRNVWAKNLREEFTKIRALVRDAYCYISMDTEFPGVVARPIRKFSMSSEYQYETLRINCNILRLIQLGLTLMDENGKSPDGITTWQFNFKFSVELDMSADDSMELLQKAGLHFSRHEREGIDPLLFSELFITSGLVLNEGITWLSFHGGYDFGYLYRILSDRKLPDDEKDFVEELKIYFPNIYDVKYLMNSCKHLKGGLQELSEDLNIQRVGQQHQAGSDAWVTGLTFFRMKELFFENLIDDSKYNGHVYGFSHTYANIANGADPKEEDKAYECSYDK